MSEQVISRSKLSLFAALCLALVTLFQNCAPQAHSQTENEGPRSHPLKAIEMTKPSLAGESVVFEGLHQIVVLENEKIEIKTACGPNREARIRNFDSDESILDAQGEVAIRIDNVRIKPDDFYHVMGCASPAMDETDELLSQIVRVERASRSGSTIYFTTDEGLVLTFELQ
ncbi:MAG: hypothetical protein KF789_02265 [Bdellovibrionaceae bacterium]|nr:hypothetical protein [Pseudobdellovibrionaceae bacterium]